MEIFKRMTAVMADIGSIAKGNVNQQQGFRYRSIDDCYNALNPLLAKHGIFTTPEVLEKTREERTNAKGTVIAFTTLRVKYSFWAPDGSSVSCIVEGEGMDSGDKSSNKALAIAHKYALLQTFCIPTEEQKDPDAEVHEVKPDPRRAKVIATLEAAAKNGGLDEMRAAWKELDKAERALVPPLELERITKLAPKLVPGTEAA